MRDCIAQEERVAQASKNPIAATLQHTKRKINKVIDHEIRVKFIRFKNENKLTFYGNIITYANILCKLSSDGGYETKQVFV